MIRRRRARTRAFRDLLLLDDHLLKDIGLTYGQVAQAWAVGQEPNALVRLNPLEAISKFRTAPAAPSRPIVTAEK